MANRKIKTLVAVTLFSICCSMPIFAADKLTVILDWFLNPDHAPLFVAQEKGFFKAQNLDVELIGPADSADPPKLVAAGKADIAITYQPRFLEQVDKGLPLKNIGILVNHPLNCLAVLKDGTIKTLADLKGKRIGFSGGTLSNITLRVMFKTAHVNVNDLELLNVHYNLTQALLTKKVDATTGMMRNFEAIQMELAGHPVLTFYPEKYGMPNYNELIFVAQANHANDARMKKFMKALTQGVAYLKQHPEEMWQAFAKAHPEMNDELNHRTWNATLQYFADQPLKFNEKEYMYFAHFMQENGLIQKVHTYSDYVAL